MVIYDFDLRRAFRRPNESHSELVVNSDRVPPLAIPRQRLKVITRRRPQIAKIASGIDVAQFPASYLDQIGRKALRALAVEDSFGGLVPEAPDHAPLVSLNDTEVKFGVSTNDTVSTSAAVTEQLTVEEGLGLLQRAAMPGKLQKASALSLDRPRRTLRALSFIGRSAPFPPQRDIAALGRFGTRSFPLGGIVRDIPPTTGRDRASAAIVIRGDDGDLAGA